MVIVLTLCSKTYQFFFMSSCHMTKIIQEFTNFQLDSPFEMARPYDLLAFLNQDTRWDNIINIHHDLSKRQQLIKGLWAELERTTDVNTLLNEDENCVKVGQLNMMDWYISSLEETKSKTSQEDLKILNFKFEEGDVPDCKKLSSLTFSMCAFEHLEVRICHIKYECTKFPSLFFARIFWLSLISAVNKTKLLISVNLTGSIIYITIISLPGYEAEGKFKCKSRAYLTNSHVSLVRYNGYEC